MSARKCVRCGERTRAGGTFLCQPCADDPVARQEKDAAEAMPVATAERRWWLVTTKNWAGGWDRETTRRMEEESSAVPLQG